MEELKRDITKLTVEQRLKLLSSGSPELIGMAKELKDKISDFKCYLPLFEHSRHVITLFLILLILP